MRSIQAPSFQSVVVTRQVSGTLTITQFDTEIEFEQDMLMRASIGNMLMQLQNRAAEMVGNDFYIEQLRGVAERVVAECVARQLTAPELPNLPAAKPAAATAAAGTSNAIAGGIGALNFSQLTQEHIAKVIADLDLRNAEATIAMQKRFATEQMKEELAVLKPIQYAPPLPLKGLPLESVLKINTTT